MIRPEDLQNRVIREAPESRAVEPPAEEVEDLDINVHPEETCPPGQPSALEHGERIGGCPFKARE